jgi:hypothetical protein
MRMIGSSDGMRGESGQAIEALIKAQAGKVVQA